MKSKKEHYLHHNQFQTLLDVLQSFGYETVGPKVIDGVIGYVPIQKATELPWGIEDNHGRGVYELSQTHHHQAFRFTNGAQGLKPYLFKPRETVWKVLRNNEGRLVFEPVLEPVTKMAFIGARACDIKAMTIQDKVLMQQDHSPYKARREALFIVAVNCGVASDNCFCVSAGVGPKATSHYDLALTELEDGFVIDAQSEEGAAILSHLTLRLASPLQRKKAMAVSQRARDMQTKRLPFDNKRELKDALFANLNHPRWEDVAEKCLSCGNCTAVCPTCFCHNEHEEPSLDGASSLHVQTWESCFNASHSYVNPHVIRDKTASRYRQWLTHKVGSWFGQFGESGCVGCGRCVSWCPVGIDMTEELSFIVETKEEPK